MKAQITRGVRVYITKEEYEFIQSIRDQVPFLLSKLPIEQQPIAQRLGDKCIFVRKKLETTTQYNLNKNVRFFK
jgi:uncharacterized protein (UPF0216 family)